MQATFENEFSLFRQDAEGSYLPIDTALCFSSIAMTEAADVIDDMVAALSEQGIPVDAYYPELGHGQHELPVRHTGALRAADNQIWFRETVRNVAHNQGLLASLAPKPMPDQAGNGCHVHWSLWDSTGRSNLLYDAEDRFSVSQVGYQFIAGVLAHLPGLLALTAPSYNSYQRLQPHFWSSAYTSWGPDNREAAVRVASGAWGRERATLNFELKASDPSNNPYLALGGILRPDWMGSPAGCNPAKHHSSIREISVMRSEHHWGFAVIRQRLSKQSARSRRTKSCWRRWARSFPMHIASSSVLSTMPLPPRMSSSRPSTISTNSETALTRSFASKSGSAWI